MVRMELRSAMHMVTSLVRHLLEVMVRLFPIVNLEAIVLCFKYEAAQMIKQEHVECPIPYCRLSVHGDLTFIAPGALSVCSETG